MLYIVAVSSAVLANHWFTSRVQAPYAVLGPVTVTHRMLRKSLLFACKGCLKL